MQLNDQMVLDSVLTEVGEGRLTVEEAEQELSEAGITPSQGFKKSLLAFSASSILTSAGYNRNGF